MNGCSSPIIEARDLAKSYRTGTGEVKALAGVSLTVEAGEFLAIVGPSGSGKTTLLDILGLLSKPSSGAYFFQNQDVSALGGNALADLRARQVGFIFQSSNLLPRETVLRNVALPMVYQGVPRRERLLRAGEAAEAVGISHRLQHRSSELSAGEQQRAAIARALAARPAVILADEPTGNLDRANGARILALFFELNARGHTVIVVTHDEELAAGAKRGITIRDGRIQG